MSNTIQKLPRLHMDADLTEGKVFSLGREQAHYLANVLRLGLRDGFRAFNGRDGEFLCHLEAVSKRGVTALCGERLAAPGVLPDIDYLFAPDDPDAFIATGFNRCYPDMVDLNDQGLRRQNALNDITETTGLVFLGLTLLAFAHLLTLFMKKGTAVPNRFGAAPTAFSFAS